MVKIESPMTPMRRQMVPVVIGGLYQLTYNWSHIKKQEMIFCFILIKISKKTPQPSWGVHQEIHSCSCEFLINDKIFVFEETIIFDKLTNEMFFDISKHGVKLELISQ